jgi:hypothetical protein
MATLTSHDNRSSDATIARRFGLRQWHRAAASVSNGTAVGLIQPAVEPLLDNLKKVAVSGDLENVCKWAEVLEYLLPLEVQAVDILADLRFRYKESGHLNRLIETLESVENPPRKVMAFLRS